MPMMVVPLLDMLALEIAVVVDDVVPEECGVVDCWVIGCD